MGMFDSVYAECPRCGKLAEFQSKVGERYMHSYTLDDAPTDVLTDVLNRPQYCGGCKTWFALVDPAFPPEHPRPNPRAVPVRDPVGDEAEVYRTGTFGWWRAAFSFADLMPRPTPTISKGLDDVGE